ncbi:Uncharacterised protein [Bordetella pertussis]|nr:Uncharacterised protein [Bordetella pertussis]CFW33014.1 Uncharacterised protein [Bordetella pertussis]
MQWASPMRGRHHGRRHYRWLYGIHKKPIEVY